MYGMNTLYEVWWYQLMSLIKLNLPHVWYEYSIWGMVIPINDSLIKLNLPHVWYEYSIQDTN